MIELPPAISNLIFCKCDSRGESYLMLFSQKKKKKKEDIPSIRWNTTEP